MNYIYSCTEPLTWLQTLEESDSLHCFKGKYNGSSGSLLLPSEYMLIQFATEARSVTMATTETTGRETIGADVTGI